ncbi:ABC transporter permease [Chitinophaga sp.]|uniref:ABC transporter permease n=1 Tax=Chitinophaga sp. TaxID=1869181 RepID=UPI0031CFB8A0
MKYFLSHIDLYHLAVFGAVFIGSYLALLLMWNKGSDRAADRWLALTLISSMLGLFWMPFGLVVGPLLYFFVRKMTDPAGSLQKADRLHFAPLIVAIAGILIPPFHQWPLVWQGTAWVCIIGYIYHGRRVIEEFYDRQSFTGNDRFRHAFRWLHHWLTGIGTVVLLSSAVTLITFFSASEHIVTQAAETGYLLLLVVIIGMASRTLLSSMSAPALNTLPLLKPMLPDDLKQKAARVRSEIRTNRYYEDPELTLTLLATKLGLTTHELSHLTNSVFKKSFNGLVNEYRVQAVIRKMQDPAYDHLTLLGIAFECGINSKPTFNRIFKQLTGKSPVEHKALLQKEVLPYNLRRYPQAPAVISKWKLNRNIMFKNYFKIAWRSLLRNMSYTIINLTGLSIGIAACLLIFLVVRYETSFDRFHTQKNQIYRVVGVTKKPSYSLSSGVAFPVADALRLDFPQLKQVATILRNEGSVFSIGDKKFKEDETYYAGPEFFQTFDFAWLAGEPRTALAGPNTGVLSRDEANRLFGDWHQALGKTLRYKNKFDFKITGILENVPANSDFPLKVVLSYATLHTKGADYDARSSDWGWVIGEHYCFVTLPQGVDVSLFNRQLDAFIKRHIPARYADVAGMQLQPLTEMHYDTRIDIFTGHPFSRALITAISLIGLFLLVIACVNFINLATAQAVNRSKEVGIRKVLGSDHPQLMLQFMSETFILTLAALLIGTLVSGFCLSLLNRLLETHLSINLLFTPAVLLFLLLTLIGVTFLAGFYPALVLSGFNPIGAFRNKIKAGRSSGISLRRVLVVFQFGIAQVLLICTLVIISQLNYFKNKSLGYNRDAIVTIPIPNDSLSRSRQAGLRDDLLQQPGIEGVSFSHSSPSDVNAWFSSIHFDHSSEETDFGVSLKFADADYFKLYKLQFVAGGPYQAADTPRGYVINETLVKKLGLKNALQAIGKTINLGGNAHTNFPVVGVVRDYITGSLKNAVPPVLMGSYKGSYQLLSVKIKPGQLQQTLTKIEQQFNAAFPQALYEYNFVDDQVARFYKTDTQLSQLYQIAAGIAILISCLGLFGLVSFMAVQRTKEVGIRKTLGASVGHIVYLFSKEFTLLVIIAFVIACPVGYYLMQQWLQSFAYRVELGPGVFLLAIAFSVLIAWITVGYKAVRAALVNPVKSLRSE